MLARTSAPSRIVDVSGRTGRVTIETDGARVVIPGDDVEIVDEPITGPTPRDEEMAELKRRAASRIAPRLDLRGERVDLQTTADRNGSPVVIRFRSWDFLKTPHWDAGADLQQVPLAGLIAFSGHMGATLPEKLAAQGAVSGSVTYNEQQGMQGRVVLRDASLSVPDAAVISFVGIEKVFIVKDGKAQEKNVTTGRHHGNLVEVVSGLRAGDMVILNPGKLRSEQPVIEESNAAAR